MGVEAIRELGIFTAGVVLASLAASGGGTKAVNNVAVTNDVYVTDDLGNDLLGNEVLQSDTALNASGNPSGNAAEAATFANGDDARFMSGVALRMKV